MTATVGSITDTWVIFRLRQKLFGVSADYVREMALLPECAAVPKSGKTVRGVMNLRGQILPVVDLRVTLGMVSSAQERGDFVAMLNAREEDHRKWLAELEASVREKREFKLTTDPHKCAFGKWYNAYKTEDLLVSSLLGKFDAPHKQIHALAEDVLALVKNGEVDQALHLIELTRNTTLKRMVELFEEFRQLLLNKAREIGLIVQTPSGVAALAVDSVESVEILGEVSTDGLDQLASSGIELVQFVGKRKDSQDIVMLLDPSSAMKTIAEGKSG